MRIPNKFNGYSRDGIRLYNDPVTAAAAGSTLMAPAVAATTTGAGTALASGLATGFKVSSEGLCK